MAVRPTSPATRSGSEGAVRPSKAKAGRINSENKMQAGRAKRCVRFLSDPRRRAHRSQVPLGVCRLPDGAQLPAAEARPPWAMLGSAEPSRPMERDGEGRLRMTPRISVVDHIGTSVPRFGAMCAAIDDVIREPQSNPQDCVLRFDQDRQSSTSPTVKRWGGEETGAITRRPGEDIGSSPCTVRAKPQHAGRPGSIQAEQRGRTSKLPGPTPTASRPIEDQVTRMNCADVLHGGTFHTLNK